jgi:hypothetical protein
MQSSPPDLGRIWQIVVSPSCTSYFNEALRQRDNPEFMRTWPDEQPRAVFHAQNKPAGPVLFYRILIAALGPAHDAPPGDYEAAFIRLAMVGGILVALLGALAVPATYAFLLAVTARREGSFAGASFLALMPGPVLFTPEFDQAFPLLTVAFLGTWIVALRRDRLAWACVCGAVLAVVLFITYIALVLGIAVVGLAVVAFLRSPTRRTAARLALHAGTVLGACGAVFFTLWVATGYDAIGSFRAAMAVQSVHLEAVARPWPKTIPFDLADFFLGAGWIVPAIAARFSAGIWRRPDLGDFAIVAVCGAQLLIAAGSGLLQGEAARVWIFLLPLLLVPAALELDSWSTRARAVGYAGAWAMLVVVAGNLSFIQP